MIPIPKNLERLRESELTETQKKLLDELTPENMITTMVTNPYKIIGDLGRHWRIKVWFSEPVDLIRKPSWKHDEADPKARVRTSRVIKTDCHVFTRMFYTEGKLCYSLNGNARSGYVLSEAHKIISYEPLPNPSKTFTFEQFKKKFDPAFITEDMIQDLWNSKSAQHGGQYGRDDFHKIGKAGRDALHMFLNRYQGLNGDSCSGRHYARSHTGRDISVSFDKGRPAVSYASEYMNCGNGRYGLLANKHEFLWLEDD